MKNLAYCSKAYFCQILTKQISFHRAISEFQFSQTLLTMFKSITGSKIDNIFCPNYKIIPIITIHKILMIKYNQDVNRLRQFKQEINPRSSRVSYEPRNQEPKFIRKPLVRARELITNNGNHPVAHIEGGSSNNHNQENLHIKFYSPKSVLKYKSNTNSFKSFKFNSPDARSSDLMDSFRGPKSQKSKFQDGRDSDNMSSEEKISSFNLMEQQKEKQAFENESRRLKKLVEKLEIQVKKLRQELASKEKTVLGNRQTLKRTQQIYGEKLADFQEKLEKGEIQIARLETELRSKDDRLRQKGCGVLPVLDLEMRIQELQIENSKLTEQLNRKIQEFKYQDIELGTLRKKKNQVVNLQIKSLRLTEKNRQLESKVQRFKNQLSKARSPKKQPQKKLRKESNDSIFSLSPDHSLDEDYPQSQSIKQLGI